MEDLVYPIFSQKLENSDIFNNNNPDLLIITHSTFFQEAQRIKALREQEGLSVTITNINDIYNQFSSGNQDISSIRNFIKYIYNISSKKLKYVILFGDCSYDYKYRVPNNTNFIPIYQDWSWSTLIEDFDLDGNNDVYVTNGIVKRPNDMDYIMRLSLQLKKMDQRFLYLLIQPFLWSI